MVSALQHTMTLHAGGRETTWADVVNVATPPNTDTHFPIPHDRLWNVVEEKLAVAGLEIGERRFALNGDDGEDFFATFTLNDLEVGPRSARTVTEADVRDALDNLEVAHTIDLSAVKTAAAVEDKMGYTFLGSLRNSHRKRFRALFGVGSRVWVCDNTCFTADLVIGRKHTLNIERDLPRVVGDLIGKVHAARLSQAQRFAAYREAAFDDNAARRAIFNAYELRALPAGKCAPVWDEWRKPTHEDFAPRTAWSFFNAVTENLKGVAGPLLSARTQRLTALVDGMIGLRSEVDPEIGDIVDVNA